MENKFKDIEDKLDELSIEFATKQPKKHFMSLTQILTIAEEYKEALIQKYIYGKYQDIRIDKSPSNRI